MFAFISTILGIILTLGFGIYSIWTFKKTVMWSKIVGDFFSNCS